MKLLFIFIGGGAGAVLRYGVGLLWSGRTAAGAFPWGTFAVNVAGCFLIGLFYALSARLQLPAGTRLLLTTGFCGGFTTFSTFSNEGLLLIRQGFFGTFAAYAGLSLLLGLAATWTGYIIAK